MTQSVESGIRNQESGKHICSILNSRFLIPASQTFCFILSLSLYLLPLPSHAQDAQPRMEPPDKQWVVYYRDALPSTAFEDYDIIVFDRDTHPSVRNLTAKGKTVLGYLSAGEAEQYRADFAQVQATHALMEENPNWPGHYVVDVRNPEWTRYLIEDVIPVILQRGFHGIFVDTLDSVEDLEVQNPEKYKGMIDASARMIKAIRHHYPTIKIMINRGFRVMPQIAQDVDYFLAEGILVNYDFEGGNHTLFPDAIYEEYVQKMLAFKEAASHLQLVTLDYWDMEDTETVREIYRRHRVNGFLPYVTTIELDRVDAEPK